MRHVFFASVLFTAMFATTLGGALSWRNTHITPRQRVSVATLRFSISYEADEDALLGPDDGVPNAVGRGNISNTGTANLVFKSGTVDVFGITGSRAACRTTSFVGTVTPVYQPGLKSIPPGSTGGGFEAAIAVLPKSPKACMGKTASYRVAVTMMTAAAN